MADETTKTTWTEFEESEFGRRLIAAAELEKLLPDAEALVRAAMDDDQWDYWRARLKALGVDVDAV